MDYKSLIQFYQSLFDIFIIPCHYFLVSIGELNFCAEYAGNLGDAGDPEFKEAEQQHILQLIDKF